MTNDAGIVEIDGTLWRQVPGATSSAEELITARRTFREVNQDADWNPWVRDERADDLDAAMTVMTQWKRAEPGHRYLTIEEFEARWAADDERARRETAAAEQRRLARIVHHDPELHAARLLLLELESIQRHVVLERNELVARPASRLVNEREHDRRVEKMYRKLAKLAAEIADIRTRVLDPEVVVDEQGRLPAERRELLLGFFRSWREHEVEAARALIPKLEQAVVILPRKSPERAKAQSHLERNRNRLLELLAIPPATAADMCSECRRPADWHRWRHRLGELTERGPCPAYPRWAARIEDIRRRFLADTEAAETKPAKPQPVAVIPSGLPIDEVIERLDEARRHWPGAEVRRDARGGWEIWPT